MTHRWSKQVNPLLRVAARPMERTVPHQLSCRSVKIGMSVPSPFILPSAFATACSGRAFRRSEAFSRIVNARGARHTHSSLRVESDERHSCMTGNLPIRGSLTKHRLTHENRVTALRDCAAWLAGLRKANHGTGTEWSKVSTVERRWIVICATGTIHPLVCDDPLDTRATVTRRRLSGDAHQICDPLTWRCQCCREHAQ